MNTANVPNRKADQSKPTVSLFPSEGKVRAKRCAEYLSIGLSTWWLYVQQGRVKQPIRYGKRVSVWNAEYVRLLGEEGIPDKGGAE